MAKRQDRNFGGMGREKRDVFLPLAIGDYKRDTSHFTTRQHGAYFLLLMAGWVEGGRLARTEEQLCTITGLKPEEWAVDRPVLAEKYRIAPNGAWVHLGMQRRMRMLGIPVAGGNGDVWLGAAAAEGGAAGEDDTAPARDVPQDLSAKRSAAARESWKARRDAKSDAKPDANLHVDDAKDDAKPDANLHADLHPESESRKNQPTSLKAARVGVALGDGGGLVDELLRIFNNPALANAGAIGECIREWRALGLNDDAICMEVQRVSDANRMQNPGWMPRAPKYYTPALHRLADANRGGADANGDVVAADQWEARVAAYAKARAAGGTGFWLDEWEGRPDSSAPNPAIKAAILAKHGFKKEAA